MRLRLRPRYLENPEEIIKIQFGIADFISRLILYCLQTIAGGEIIWGLINP